MLPPAMRRGEDSAAPAPGDWLVRLHHQAQPVRLTARTPVDRRAGGRRTPTVRPGAGGPRSGRARHDGDYRGRAPGLAIDTVHQDLTMARRSSACARRGSRSTSRTGRGLLPAAPRAPSAVTDRVAALRKSTPRRGTSALGWWQRSRPEPSGPARRRSRPPAGSLAPPIVPQHSCRPRAARSRTRAASGLPRSQPSSQIWPTTRDRLAGNGSSIPESLTALRNPTSAWASGGHRRQARRWSSTVERVVSSRRPSR